MSGNALQCAVRYPLRGFGVPGWCFAPDQPVDLWEPAGGFGDVVVEPACRAPIEYAGAAAHCMRYSARAQQALTVSEPAQSAPGVIPGATHMVGCMTQ